MSNQPVEIAYAPGQIDARSWLIVRRREKPIEALIWAGSTIGWSLLVLVILGAPLTALIKISGPFAFYPFLVAGVLVMPILAAAARGVRRRRMASLLGYLQQAVRLNLPLPRFLAAAARSHTGRVSRQFSMLKEKLEGGLPLAAALAMTVREMPERTLALIEYAEETGRLPQMLDRLVEEQIGESRKPRGDEAFALWYPAILLFTVAAVIWMISTFVFAKLEFIDRSFKLRMPGFAPWIYHSADWIVWIALFLAWVLLLRCAARLREAFRSAPSTWLFRGITDRLLWTLPLAHGQARDRAMGDLCAALADAIEVGHPLEESLSRAMQLDVNRVMKKRIVRWAEGLANGLPPAEAARRAAMPRFMVGMLATASAAPVMADVFRFLARFYSRRFVLRRELVRGTYLPVVTLLMALIVTAVALTLFLPLVNLMDHLSGSL